MRWAEQQADAGDSLSEALRLQRDAARLGFDWPELAPLWTKLGEETAELKAAIEQGDQDAIEDEFGDMLFMLANFSRFLRVSPQAALHRTNQKFIDRLRHVEARLDALGRSWETASLEELEGYWQEAKRRPGSG